MTRRRGTIAAALSPSNIIGFRVCKGVASTEVETLRCSKDLSPVERNELGRDVEMVESVSLLLSSAPSSRCCWSTSMASTAAVAVVYSYLGCVFRCVCLPLEVIFESKPVKGRDVALVSHSKLELLFKVVDPSGWLVLLCVGVMCSVVAQVVLRE